MLKNSSYNQHFKKLKRNVELSDSGYPKANRESNQKQSLSIEQLRKKVAQKNIKPKRKFPLVQFIVFIACSVGLFFAVESYDKLETYLHKIEIGIGLAHAESTQETTVQPATKTEEKKLTSTETVNNENSESDALDKLYKLTERKKELDLREEDINKKAKEIDQQKTYVEQKLKELEEYRIKISSMLQDRVKADAAKIDNLVQIYTNMRPGQAAKVFETMDEDLVIEILSKMKKKTAADVLNLMKAEKAQLFAERYAGYRLPAALTKTDTKTDGLSADKDTKKEDVVETQKP